MNLKSHRHLSIGRQNSQNTNDSEFPGSGRTDTILHGYRKPLQESTESLSWHSQERTQGITSKLGSKHSDENLSFHRIGTMMQGTWNQESSKSSRQEYECSHSIGKPKRGTHTRKKTRPELRNMEITNTGYMIKVFNNLRSKLAEVQNLPEFAMEACKMNMLMWSWFYNSSMKAAIHLSLEHIEYLEMSKNSEFDDIEGFFYVTKNLIADNEEIRNIAFLDWSSPSWTRSTLLNDRATQLTKAKVYVCTDSALCFLQGKQLNS